jgi:hypothetical protein
MLDLALDDSIFIESRVNAALQELDILFNTENTELIGYPTFGSNFEQFLWQLNPSPNALKSYMEEIIKNNTLFCNEFEIMIDVKIVEGEYRNIYNVIIILKTDMKSDKAVGYRLYQLR